MFAVKFVEFAIIGGVVFRAVPPVPVATFGNKNFFESEFALGLAGARGTLRIELARMMEVVPGAIVFGSTDPDIEVSVDPRAGEKGCETRKILVAGNCLGDGNGFDDGIALQRIVEAAKKFATGFWVIFPGVFAVENN